MVSHTSADRMLYCVCSRHWRYFRTSRETFRVRRRGHQIDRSGSDVGTHHISLDVDPKVRYVEIYEFSCDCFYHEFRDSSDGVRTVRLDRGTGGEIREGSMKMCLGC